jgi:hypothetical protein
MEHVVFFPGPDGAPVFRRFSGQAEALRFVERLRNVEGVTEFSVHGLTPVPLAMRPYYRVEPVAAAPVPEPVAPAPQPVASAPQPVVPALADPAPQPNGAVFADPEPVLVAPAPVAAPGPVAAPVPVAFGPEEPVPAEDAATEEVVVPLQAVTPDVLVSGSPAEPVLPDSEHAANGRRGLGFFNR